MVVVSLAAYYRFGNKLGNPILVKNIEALTAGEATDMRTGFVAAYVVVGTKTIPCCVETPENYTCDYNKYNCIRYFPN